MFEQSSGAVVHAVSGMIRACIDVRHGFHIVRRERFAEIQQFDGIPCHAFAFGEQRFRPEGQSVDRSSEAAPALFQGVHKILLERLF